MTSDKLTIKQEKFAQKYVECGNASEAYRYAYNAAKMSEESIWVAACRLAADAKVKPRINELKEHYRKKNEITLEYITQGLKNAINLALSKEDASNARQGHMDLAKLHGLIVDRKKVEGEISINQKRGAIAERFAKRFIKGE